MGKRGICNLKQGRVVVSLPRVDVDKKCSETSLEEPPCLGGPASPTPSGGCFVGDAAT